MKNTLIFAALVLIFSSAAFGQTDNKVRDELIKLETDFNTVMLQNDVKVIEGFMSDDWIIVDADGGLNTRAGFLAVIKSGTLTHSSMQAKDVNIRIFNDDSAVITGLATSKGKYAGKAFTSVERFTDVFVKKDGRWQCVLTHLTRTAVKK